VTPTGKWRVKPTESGFGNAGRSELLFLVSRRLVISRVPPRTGPGSKSNATLRLLASRNEVLAEAVRMKIVSHYRRTAGWMYDHCRF
jgi:hypothetical protein